MFSNVLAEKSVNKRCPIDTLITLSDLFSIFSTCLPVGAIKKRALASIMECKSLDHEKCQKNISITSICRVLA